MTSPNRSPATSQLPSLTTLLEADAQSNYQIVTHAPGPQGQLPLTEQMLQEWPSGDLFGLTQNAGMGWPVTEMLGPEVLILSTSGGVRAEDGSPIALGFHTGHYEVILQVQAAAREVKASGGVPFAAFCSDPCDGRTQGTVGMFDSLPYRNDAAQLMRRQIRSLPTRRAVIGVATCDKGLPAMMMALAGTRDLPCILVPGGVTLPPSQGEDAGKIQTIGARFAHGEISLAEAASLGCRACGSPGGGCQFLGTAATSQIVGEALGLALPHSALAPSGQTVWLDLARRSARAVLALNREGLTTADILSQDSVYNAMVVHAAVGGSTNLLLHIPAVAFSAGLPRPTLQQWEDINRKVPRLVDALPNGPVGHPTVRVFLAGGVPEVMLHLRRLGLLRLQAQTVTGKTLDEVLTWWESSTRRQRMRQLLWRHDGIDPDEVILPPEKAAEKGLTSTVCFPRGNLAPEGSVIKSTALDPSVVDSDGVYRHRGRARVFQREPDAIAAIKDTSVAGIKPGDVIVLMCRGPLGSGMEETYQVTSALKHLSWGKTVAVVTDARFSGVSTGACVGHVGPEALAGGPISKIREGDQIQIVVDRVHLTGSVDLVGELTADGSQRDFDPEEGARILANRPARNDLAPDDQLPPETRLWAVLQQLSGGTWGGCVYDVERITDTLGRPASSTHVEPEKAESAAARSH